ncbi:citrate lyase subunit beta / citryl-CoA lyase [Glycomyces sambucus]|uniref:Citrate lyase subunit beta / citryl-CoA lyase n=1 Tax=Glycomyces sambucus TaxID=380244 RepID=A0A1G9F0S5_9ACTN|nr:aldolase/citrate lyase family protein [Glycomyces sambucus]SDK81883.1 citrate lyase subunit beta / citryl-CoA lyase [Glycomyces sambucus]
MNPVSALYVPGDRPDRFDKAAASGADVVILDLEDAVADAAKAAALDHVTAWLAARTGGPEVQVRVNVGADHEIRAVRATGAHVGLRIPKVEAPEDLGVIASLAQGLPLTALVESARGLQNAGPIAAHPAVAALALGEADLASDLGSTAEAVLDHARIRLLVAARAAGLPAPMLSVYPRIQDLDGLRADTERGRALGLRGRTAVHPKQLPVIREVFAPDPEETAWAEAVVAALGGAADGGGGVATLPSGEMVDPAMLGRARAILAAGRP